MTGRRDRLPPPLRAEIERAEAATAGGRALHLRVAIDYSGRDAILRAAEDLGASGDEYTREKFAAHLCGAACDGDRGSRAAEVDLLIRTGGERRLSDFLLWESAYAELYFTERMWPDFGAADLERAVGDYHTRERRFGRVPAAAAGGKSTAAIK